MKYFEFRIRKFKSIIPTLILLVFSIGLNAQETAKELSFLDKNFEEIVLIILVTVLLLAFWGISQTLNGLIKIATLQLTNDQKEKLALATAKNEKTTFWQRLNQKLTDAVPIVEENDILLDHDYDGIKELDNHLPPWWKWMFYASIIYAVFHLAYFTLGGNGMNQFEQYEHDVAQAEIQQKNYLASMANNVDETNVAMLSDAASLQAGKRIFIANCASCHGQLGEGLVGPNLTDEYWIHGGKITDIFKTVKYGIPTKMIPWKDQLLPSQMSEVASYVMSIQGSNPPNALDPQGKLYQPEGDTDASAEVETSASE